MKNCVFIHVPRTGGSSLWHSLVPLATSQGRGICDIYHESKLRFGNPSGAAEVVRQVRSHVAEMPVVFHHHTSEPIPEIFNSSDSVLATVLRDPVDQFVSATFHRQAFLRNCQEAAHVEFHSKLWGAEFVRVATDEQASSRDVLSAAANVEMFCDFYTRYFGDLLEVARPKLFRAMRRSSHARRLAQRMRDRFSVIAQFSDLTAAHSQIAAAFRIEETARFSVSLNRAKERQTLSPAERMKYRRLFQADYALLEQLGAERKHAVRIQLPAQPRTVRKRETAWGVAARVATAS